MSLNTSKLNQIEFDEISSVNFVGDDTWSDIRNKMKELQFFISEMELICTRSNVPSVLKNATNGYISKFLEHWHAFTEKKHGSISINGDQMENQVRKFFEWYSECIENSKASNQRFTFFDVYNTLKNISKPNFMDEKMQMSTLIEEAKADLNSIDTIFKEIRKKTSEFSVSDYAKIFEVESNSSRTHSKYWLGSGLILSAIFLIILLFTDVYDKFPTETVTANNELIKYNITNVLIKLLVFAIQIYLISFSFKQYYICKHLQTINRHRQNAFNSFKLFAESIDKQDIETRNSLLLQLSKAVYEQVTTGYISDKNQNVNPGIIEITKMIGSNGNS